MQDRVKRDGMTDPKILAEGAYGTTSNLDRRKALYQFTTPFFVIEDEILNLSQFTDGLSMLDVGCGTGKLLLKTAAVYPNSKLVGLDISENMLKAAKQKTKKDNLLNIQFQIGDVQDIPFPMGSFDRVVAMHMLYHVSDIGRALSEISRVLKPDGVAVVTANSMHSRKKLNSLKALAAKIMNREVFSDPNRRFNLEVGPEMLKRYFSLVELSVFESTLHLTEPQPYIDYFDSLRSFWQPYPGDNDWAKVMSAVREQIETEIHSSGEFNDNTGFGVMIGSNSPITASN